MPEEVLSCTETLREEEEEEDKGGGGGGEERGSGNVVWSGSGLHALPSSCLFKRENSKYGRHICVIPFSALQALTHVLSLGYQKKRKCGPLVRRQNQTTLNEFQSDSGLCAQSGRLGSLAPRVCLTAYRGAVNSECREGGEAGRCGRTRVAITLGRGRSELLGSLTRGIHGRMRRYPGEKRKTQSRSCVCVTAPRS